MHYVRTDSYGLSEGNPSEKGTFVRRYVHMDALIDSPSGIRMDAQCALDYVLSHEYLSKTKIVSTRVQVAEYGMKR